MTDPQTGVALAAKAGAAMCVRSVDDQGVLQFTLILAAGCVLHRRTSRVIHRQELFLGLLISHSREILSCRTPGHVRKKITGERRRACKTRRGSFPRLRTRRTSLQALQRDTPGCRGVVRPPSLGPGARQAHVPLARGTAAPGRPAQVALPKLTVLSVHGVLSDPLSDRPAGEGRGVTRARPGKESGCRARLLPGGRVSLFAR